MVCSQAVNVCAHTTSAPAIAGAPGIALSVPPVHASPAKPEPTTVLRRSRRRSTHSSQPPWPTTPGASIHQRKATEEGPRSRSVTPPWTGSPAHLPRP
jgi:hypothetical protein